MLLLERTALKTLLEDRLVNAQDGRGSVVCVVGGAGVGKTALTKDFVECADARVLWGACEDLVTPEALGPLRDWVRETRLLPFTGLPQTGHRIELFSDVLEALSETCTVAVIEDMHWADDATLDLVRFLGRRIADKQVLLIITARNEDSAIRKRLRNALVQIPPSLMSYLDVPNLSSEAVSVLANETGKDGASIYEATGGNAFYVTEILQGNDALPASVRDAVLARFDRLTPECRRALEVSSIFPRRVEASLLHKICPKEAKEIGQALHAGLLVEGDGEYAFRHEIARRAIEDEIPFDRRRAINSAALAALRSDPQSSISRLVHHAKGAGDSAAVRELAPAAAAEASRVGAHREAARHFGTALEYMEDIDSPELALLLGLYAFELHLIGEVKESIAAYEAALSQHKKIGDRIAEGDGLRWMSRVHYLAGDRLSAERFGREAMTILEAEPAGAELAMAYSNLGQLAMLADDPAAALAWSRKAREIATALGRNDIVAHALNNAGTAQRWLNKDATRDGLSDSLNLALEYDLAEHVARAYTNFAYVEIGWLEHENAHAMLKSGLAYCEERDLHTWQSYMNGMYAQLLAREGRWDETAEIAVGEITDDRNTPMLRFPAVAALARVRMRRGDPDTAPLLEALETYIETGNEPQRFLLYVSVLAEHGWISGTMDERKHGLMHKASQIAEQIGDIWSVGDLWFWGQQLGIGNLPIGSAARPYQLMSENRWDEAAQEWLDLGCPYDRALALVSGDKLARREGLACLDALGARVVADRFRSHLRQQGKRTIPRGPQIATRTNPAGLTRRQMTVLGLLAEGLSNAAIADKLYLSAKTVDHHVSAILAKLEAKTRGRAVALARAAGLI